MAIPAIVGTPTEGSNAASGTITLPTGWVENDVIFVFIATLTTQPLLTTAGQTPKFIAASDSGWTAMAGSPQTVAGGSRLYGFWRRMKTGDTAPQTSDSGEYQAWNVIAVRGALLEGTPFEALAFGEEEAVDVSLSIPALNTLGVDRLVIGACSTGADATADQFSAWSNVNLADPAATEAADVCTSAGGGGGVASYYGGKATEGSTGATTATLATTSSKAFVHLAVIPQPPLEHARWKLNDATGVVAVEDLDVNVPDGTYVGSPTLNQTGIVPAYSDSNPIFDGVNDYLTVPVNINAWVAATYKVWVRPDTLAFHQLFALAAAGSAWLTAAGAMKADIDPSESATQTVEQASAYVADEVFCVHVTYANGRFRLYKNGTKLKESTAALGTLLGPGVPNVGTNDAASSGFLKGALARFEVWRKELSEAEVLADYEIDATLPGKTIPLGQAVEADTALALLPRKRLAVGVAATADTATTLGGSKRRQVGQASEANAALLARPAHVRALATAAEFDAATALVGRKVRTLGQAAEVDAALAASGSKRGALGQAAEVDEARLLLPARGLLLGVAVEVSLALPAAAAKLAALGLAFEADEALPAAGRKLAALGIATELAEALAAVPAKGTALGQAVEADEATALARVVGGVLGVAVEVDLAGALHGAKLTALGMAVEVDAARGVFLPLPPLDPPFGAVPFGEGTAGAAEIARSRGTSALSEEAVGAAEIPAPTRLAAELAGVRSAAALGEGTAGAVEQSSPIRGAREL